MNQQYKFIIAAASFLIPVFVIMAQQVFLFIGRLAWNWLLPKLKRTSKLRYNFIKLSVKYQAQDVIYIMTGILLTWIISIVIFVLVS